MRLELAESTGCSGHRNSKAPRATGAGREKSKPRPSPSPFPTNRPNSFVAPSMTIESLKNSSTRCELLASRCSSTPSKDPHVEKEEYHPKCALTSRHSVLPITFLRPAWYMENAVWDLNPARDTGVIQ